MSRYITAFNTTYDVASRLVKIVLFLIAVGLLVWQWPHIDWNGTSNNLIATHTPFQVQQTQVTQPSAPPATPPSATTA